MKSLYKKNKIVTILALVIIIAIIGLGGYYVYSGSPVDKTDAGVVIVNIPTGSNTETIAAELKDEDLIRSEFMFKLSSRMKGFDSEYKAGSYGVSKDMSREDQMELIASGKTIGKNFVILEGNTVEKDAVILEEKDVVSVEEFMYEVEHGEFDYPFMEFLPEGSTRLEGFLFPNSYQIGLDGTAHDAIDVMLREFNRVFTEEDYKKAEKMDMTVLEVMTVASIIEKEAKTEEDKYDVASVIYNRLDIEMPLQMDSILSYILKEDKIKASLADTQVSSDYNPYQNNGLPPGPICSPGRIAIDAALNPSDTEYIYFVAGEELDGTNVFSVTYEDFLKDKAKFDEAYKEYIKENPGKV